MNDLRAAIAIFISCASTYLVYDLFVNGFSWTVLIAAMIGYCVVHMLWPKNGSSDSHWYDAMDLLFDLPYKCMALFFAG